MLSGLAAAPALAAQHAIRDGLDPLVALAPVLLPVTVTLAVVAGFVRFRDDLHQWWQQQKSLTTSASTTKGRQP